MNTNISSSLERLVQNYYLHELHILGDSTHINNRYADKHKSELPSEDEDAITFFEKIVNKKITYINTHKDFIQKFLELDDQRREHEKDEECDQWPYYNEWNKYIDQFKKNLLPSVWEVYSYLLAYDHAIDRMTIMLKKAVVMIN